MNNTIVIADDHPLYREALIESLHKKLPNTELIEAGDYLTLFEELKLSRDKVDLILLDLNMPGCQGYSGLIFLKKYFPELPVMVITAHNSPEIMKRCYSLQADSFVSKTASSIRIVGKIKHLLENEDAFERIHGAEPLPINEKATYQKIVQLTPHQFHILTLVSEGLLNKQIAARLSITEKTIKAHLSKIFRILEVSNRTQASKFVMNLDLNSTWQ